MKTLTLEIGIYPEEVLHGPPLPHSLWLWELWGCYEHYDCVIFQDLFTPKGERYRIIHRTLDEIRVEAQSCATTCECYRHWLLGEMAHKDHPQTYEPVIQQHKKGRKK